MINQFLFTFIRTSLQEYKNLENFECLPIIPVTPTESQTDQTTPLTSLQQLSPPETTASLDWKSVASNILDAMAERESLLLSSSQTKSLLKPSQPTTINEIREKVQQGSIQSLEETKEAVGLLILASSLHLGPEEKEKRAKLVQLFDHLL